MGHGESIAGGVDSRVEGKVFFRKDRLTSLFWASCVFWAGCTIFLLTGLLWADQASSEQSGGWLLSVDQSAENEFVKRVTLEPNCWYHIPIKKEFVGQQKFGAVEVAIAKADSFHVVVSCFGNPLDLHEVSIEVEEIRSSNAPPLPFACSSFLS